MTAALVATTGVFAKKVKIQVNMAGQTVSANGVHVAGNFQGWSPSSTALSQEGSSTLYSTVVDINAFQTIEYKFINDNNWGSGEEAIPTISKVESAANGGSNGNRWAYIDSMANDTTLLSFTFGGSAPAGKYAVRFAVDMQKESRIDANGIHVVGDFQGWNPAGTRMVNLFTNNKVYEVILTMDSANYGFKYVNGNIWSDSTDERGIPSTCSSGGNRQLAVTGTTTLAKVCFNSCTACTSAPIPTYSLKFQVDMSNSDCDGGFDSVTVAGNSDKLTKFGVGVKMNQVGSTGVYDLTIADLDSGEVKFKFRYHKNGNTNWEGGSDRIVNHAAAGTVDLTCFGSRTVGPCPSKPSPSKITFILDMIDETPGSEINIMGTFATPNWQAGAKKLSPIPGNAGLYSITIDSICPGSFNYKFVNGDPNAKDKEESFGDSTNRACVESNGIGGFNRVYTRTTNNAITINYKFNTCTAGRTPVNGVNENSLSANLKLYPNPTSTYTVVEFNDNSVNHDVVVMDITGRVVKTFSNHKYNTLRIDREELTSGIYFINVRNANNETGSIKLMID